MGNAVNVFLGIGIAWSLAAIVHAARETVGGFRVPAGSLGFSVTIFVIEALLAILILLARRHPKIGGELGGPKVIKTISTGVFFFFWIFYVLISAMEAFGTSKGFSITTDSTLVSAGGSATVSLAVTARV